MGDGDIETLQIDGLYLDRLLSIEVVLLSLIYLYYSDLSVYIKTLVNNENAYLKSSSVNVQCC